MSTTPNPDCYARALGGCSDQKSREHYVSEGALKYVAAPTTGNLSVYARYHGRQKRGVQKLLDIGRLTAEILCTKHNNSLGPVDDESIRMCGAAESMYDADNSGDQTAEGFPIDGDRLERWMLKTLIGGLYSGKLWDDLAHMERQPPPIQWLEALYGYKELPDGQGLYWQPTEMDGLSFEERDQLEILPWLSADNGTVIGLHAWFFGFHLALLAANVVSGSVVGQYRPAGLRISGCNKRITFTWKSGPEYQEVTLGR
jgi:hypothetical protein